jgi:hypothetical protein
MTSFSSTKTSPARLLASAGKFALACVLLMTSLSGHAEEAPVSAYVEVKPPAGAFTPEKPDYLYFKDVKVTRNQKMELTFEVTLRGKIPTRTDEKIRFYVGFDIDSDATTGGTSVNNSDFGQDIGIWFFRDPKSSQFSEYTGDIIYKGISRDLRLTQVRIQGNTIKFKVRSDLFSLFPSMKVFLSAEHTFYDHGRQTQSVEVSQAGVFSLGS